jgi:hypothetical protein
MKCSLIRPQEMGRYVERDTIDVGIAGRDWVRENDSDVVEVFDLLEVHGANAGRMGIPESSGSRPGWFSPWALLPICRKASPEKQNGAEAPSLPCPA